MDKALIDILWVTASIGVVFLMQAGFLCLETGLTRRKNNINVGMKNLADFGMAVLLFWAFGFALMFGLSKSGWYGGADFMLNLAEIDLWKAVFFIFQAMFCGTAVTILSGATAERMRFSGYLIVSILLSALIYPLFGHWAWNGIYQGTVTGWLGALGFVDFAGASVVHSVGGAAALAVLLVIGPRMGRFSKGELIKIPAANIPQASLGVILLWIGWLGFNGGSTLGINEKVVPVMTNTILSGAAGLVCTLVVGWQSRGRPDVDLVLNGPLAGLVAITGSAHAVSTSKAIMIGAIAGLVMLALNRLLLHFRIDDAVGAVPVHLGAGIWGTLAVALFGQLELLGTGLTRGAQLGIQLLGIGVCFTWAFGVTYLIVRLIDRFYPLRVTTEAEDIGLNISEHNARSDLLDLFTIMEEQSKTGNLSLRVPVEPFTIVGQIAQRYNEVMQALEEAVVKRFELMQATLEAGKARQAAEAANRAKSAFLANVSHELRTPLNAILGFAQLMSRSQTLSVKERENLDIIQRTGEHLLRLINNIIDFSKMEGGQMRLHESSFDLYALLEELHSICLPAAEAKGLQLRLERASSLPQYVHTDAVKLRQILMQLLSNAIKFTEQGSILWQVESLPPHDYAKDNKSQPPSDLRLHFEVQDSGIGIAPDELESMFSPFVQSDMSLQKKEGIGLGLPISREFVRLMGGELEVRSQVGQGTTFAFEIQVTVSEASDIQSKEATRRVIALFAPQPRYRILIVDDKWTNRQLLYKWLNPLGFDVREASNGQQAVELWDAWEPHLIWMDMRMPVMDGYEATKRIKSTTKGQATAIIALTVGILQEKRAVVLSAGCDDSLPKPFREADIFEMMHKHLGVRYIYDEPALPAPSSDVETHLTPAAQRKKQAAGLAALPSSLLAALQEAAESCDIDGIEQVLEQVGSHHATLASQLQSLADDFEYDEILELIEEGSKLK